MNALPQRQQHSNPKRVGRCIPPVKIFLTLLALSTVAQQPYLAIADEPTLKPVAYNHPGLTVDLGVGLWAWPVPCDADGDGDFDLIVSCPDKPSNGIWFFENEMGDTAKHGMPVFKPAKRLSSTVHYVMPSYVDGEMRVLSPGFEYTNFTQTGLSEKVALPIAPSFYKPQWQANKGPRVRHNQWRYADYNQDGALDLVVGIEDWSEYGWDDAWNEQGEWQNGALHGLIFVFQNRGSTDNPKYDNPQPVLADGIPLDVNGCPSPNFNDFDNDGDLDILCGEFLDGFTYFENIGSATEPEYAKGRPVEDSDGKAVRMDLQMIVPIAFDWDRDGNVDLIVGDEDGRVALVRSLGTMNSQRTPQFSAPAYFQQQADTLKCGALATPFVVDWDGDGDEDILSGNTAGYIEFFENLSDADTARPKWNRPVRLRVDDKEFRILAGPNGSIQGPAEAKWGYTTLSVADWDHDGLPDIIFNSIWGRIQWLRNVGTRQQPRLTGPLDVVVEWKIDQSTPKPAWTWWDPDAGQLVTQWRTTPVAVDWNHDGLTDIVMLDPQGYLSLYRREKRGEGLVLLPPERVFVELIGATDNNANASIVSLQLNSKTAGGSGRRKLCIVDWDGDGLLDILANSTNADWLQQTENKDGDYRFVNRGRLVNRNISGHSTSPAVCDFDRDGIPDFLGGAEDGQFYFMRNPRSVADD